MYRKQLLKAMLVAHESTPKDLSNVINRKIDTVYSKINGETEFTRKELSQIKDHYGLSVEEMSAIFFAQ